MEVDNGESHFLLLVDVIFGQISTPRPTCVQWSPGKMQPGGLGHAVGGRGRKNLGKFHAPGRKKRLHHTVWSEFFFSISWR